MPYAKEYKELFYQYNEFDLCDKKIKECKGNFIFLEIKTITKENFKKLNEFIKNNRSKEIYIFSYDYENSLLLKFALHFSVHKPLNLEMNRKEFEKILFHFGKKYLSKLEEKRENEIGKNFLEQFPFIVIKSGNIVFANSLIKDIFEKDTLKELGDYLNSIEKLESFLASSEGQVELTLTQHGENYEYVVYKKSMFSGDGELVTFIPIGKEDTNQIKIIDRLRFIDMLKDELVQANIDNRPISLIFINIANHEKLVKSLDSLEYHYFIKDFISRLNRHKKSYQELIQWDFHLFILLNYEEFAISKEDLNYIHQKIIYEYDDEKISPVIISSIFDISDMNINTILNTVEQISSRDFNKKNFDEARYTELKHLDDFIDENEQIRYYLQSSLASNTPIKLLNIYKGLCINMKSKVLKIEDKEYFVHCESLQGYSMQFDDKTILQSPDFPKDIEADVKYVNFEKSYAVLENLKFLETSANNRQYTRVQPKIRTPITIKHKRRSFQGEILDISTKAIAIKYNHLLDNYILNETVELKFKLPDEEAENGFIYMEVEGKIINISEIEENKTKIVTILKLERPYDSFLLKYMYVRQKELILELKKAVKLAGK